MIVERGKLVGGSDLPPVIYSSMWAYRKWSTRSHTGHKRSLSNITHLVMTVTRNSNLIIQNWSALRARASTTTREREHCESWAGSSEFHLRLLYSIFIRDEFQSR
jgi:hypothetical protein